MLKARHQAALIFISTMQLDPNPPEFPAPWAVAWGEDKYGLWQAFEINGTRQVMRWIPPGEFLMGSPENEPERSEDETLHKVTLTQGYWLADTACTQALWQAVMDNNPSHFDSSTDLPVENISWHDSNAFISLVNEHLADRLTLRLPTEAEWEYACRAGSDKAFGWGDELDTGQANYDGNYPYNDGPKGEYRHCTLPAQHFRPNDWGLYQMHGNVWEWCADWYDDYPNSSVVDPVGPANGQYRVLRGGSWLDSARYLRSAFRFHLTPDLRLRSFGLRLAGG